MTSDLISLYIDAYRALKKLPNDALEATGGDATMFNIRCLLSQHGVSVEPMQ